jgi:iron complex outermembrane receptor protein
MPMSSRGRARVAATAIAATFAAVVLADDKLPPESPQDLTQLSLEQLAGLKVEVAARRPQRQWDVPAATATIPAEDVVRTGLTSLPEALRLAPGVHVARASSNSWAFGIRGFSSTLSRSVLALVDGRSIYTPLFAGVYWEQQHVLLADVDRIEVVRGPGGTLWGANAVNGVVSVVTRSAHATHGLYAEAGGGTTERLFGALRYGGALAESVDYRVYGRYFDRGPEHHGDGREFDDWSVGQGGFRLDWSRGPRDALTFQGDLYDGRAGQRRTVAQYEPPYAQVVEGDGEFQGANLLAHWRRGTGESGSLSVRSWYDRTERREAYLEQSRDTFDVELQHDSVLGGRHHLVWGLGYRVTSDATSGLPGPFFDPESRSDSLYSGFVQDELRFAGERLALTAGVKLEHNDYSGFEAQPSTRLLWAVSPRQRAWLAASRAVRTPSRADADQVQTVFLQAQGPVFVRAVGDKGFDSERAWVFEAGYRLQPLERLSFEAASFYDRYANLLGGRIGSVFVESDPPPPRIVVPVLFGNLLEGETWGGELSLEARPLAGWRLHGAYSYLRVVTRPHEPAPPRITPDQSGGASPRHQLFVRSSHDLPHGVAVDAFFRYVGELKAQSVPAYSTLDVRLAWRPTPSLELAVVGQNLLQPHHKEWGGDVEIRRGVYGQVSLRP